MVTAFSAVLQFVLAEGVEALLPLQATSDACVSAILRVRVPPATFNETINMIDVILKRFDRPDETLVFEKGKFETVSLGGMTIGRATYEPGWKWSADVGKKTGEAYCSVEHVGMVVSGCATAAFADGRVTEMKAGDVFYVPPEPHDSWVIGDEPYVSLHFLGANHYAK